MCVEKPMVPGYRLALLMYHICPENARGLRKKPIRVGVAPCGDPWTSPTKPRKMQDSFVIVEKKPLHSISKGITFNMQIANRRVLRVATRGDPYAGSFFVFRFICFAAGFFGSPRGARVAAGNLCEAKAPTEPAGEIRPLRGFIFRFPVHLFCRWVLRVATRGAGCRWQPLRSKSADRAGRRDTTPTRIGSYRFYRSSHKGMYFLSRCFIGLLMMYSRFSFKSSSFRTTCS